MTQVYKTGIQSAGDPFSFVLSDSTVDRMGDTIRAEGWDLTDFKKSPIALFSHDHQKPIGVWENVRVENKALVGTLRLAKAGTSEFIDTIRSLIEQKILKAVSVGFQPIEAVPRKTGGGYDYIKQALHEVSVCSVPANPNALAVAKALNPRIAEKLFVQSDSRASGKDGQSTPQSKTPKLDSARKRLGID